MQVNKIFLAALFLLIPILALAKPKIEYRLTDGDCDGGGSWWIVQKFQDGKLVEVHGMDCQGNEWSRYPPQRVAADPTIGEPPTFTGTGENGEPWYSVLHYTSEGIFTWAGGRDSFGSYWIMGDAPSTGLN